MKARFAPALVKPVVSAIVAATLITGSYIAPAITPAASAAPNTSSSNAPAVSKENPLGLAADAAILIDADTGQVLYSYNIDKPLPPASMTKMMTEYMVLSAVKSGKLKWDQEISVSNEAASTPKDGSQIYLAEGDTHTVKELYTAMSVASANDATVALASFLGGSEAGFVTEMNAKAQELGLKTAQFTSATGLLDTTVIAAKDMAKLAMIILKETPEFLDYSKIPSVKFRERDAKPMINNDWMLEGNKGNTNFKQYVYDGVDGMKTGYLSAAGYCFTGTVKRGDTRLISVVYHTKTKGARFLETRKLYDWAFSNLERKTIVQPKTVVESAAEATITKGKEKTVGLVTESDFTLMVKKGAAVEPKIIATSIPKAGELVAPVAQGQKIGTVTYKYTDADTGTAVTKEINLIAAEGVEKAGWFKLMLRGIGGFFSGLFKGIVDLF
ncbi:D-alanyl-D-alanine carboxypeptidase family protein [Paenibacillus sp. D51F]